ncbi:MAG: class I SAM-dependent methyltransferase [Rhodobacteraceae bacterium]|nr:class I SAM-dependent methyltransferase [Paracoccaceae bacterium]
MTLLHTLFHDPAPRSVRLNVAMAEGLSLPDGSICVMRPRAGEQFTPLPMDRLQMVQGFAPDYTALQAAGHTVSATPLPAPSALICLPRSKAEGLGLIAQAVAGGAQCVMVDGQKTDGVESVLKAVRARVAVGGVVSKAHGKLFWFSPGAETFADWQLAPQAISDPDHGAFQTMPGLFSAGEVDPASRLLAEHLPDTLPARIADLGAGWGYLAAACLARNGVEELHLVEAEATALELARANITDPRAQFHWADGTQPLSLPPLGGVIMNPPFHTGRTPQPALGLAFIDSAARLLTGRGQLWMVANRHLPYDRKLSERFSQHQILAETGAFRVWHASGPRSRPAQNPSRQRRERSR